MVNPQIGKSTRQCTIGYIDNLRVDLPNDRDGILCPPPSVRPSAADATDAPQNAYVRARTTAGVRACVRSGTGAAAYLKNPKHMAWQHR